MIFEKLELNFNYELLKEEFLQAQRQFAPVMLNSHFGGWSVTSSNGSYQDGWIKGDHFAEANAGASFDLVNVLKKANFKSLADYRIPTEACGEQTLSLLKNLSDLGFNPRRARYMLLKSHGQSNYHRDCPEDIYAVRLHIPIITNPLCSFMCEEGSVHLEAGQTYLLRVNRLHQVVNHGNSDRIHFICDVFDSTGASKFHRMSAEEILKIKQLREQFEKPL